jgi:hypothetical protein
MAARLVRLLMARLVQAGQGAVGRPGEHAALTQERLGLVKRPERPVPRQPAFEGAALAKPGQRLHAFIIAPGIIAPAS